MGRLVALGGCALILAGLPCPSMASERSSQLAQVSDADCRTIGDPKARLECFDKSVAQPNPTKLKPTESSGPSLKGAEKNPPKPMVVDAVDLGVGSRKYHGKTIEVRGVWCYYADVADYRCMTESSVVVFSKAIVPVEQREMIEANCSELRKAHSTPACRRSIRFEFAGDDVSQDTISGNRTRTVISPDQIEALPNSPRRR